MLQNVYHLTMCCINFLMCILYCLICTFPVRKTLFSITCSVTEALIQKSQRNIMWPMQCRNKREPLQSQAVLENSVCMSAAVPWFSPTSVLHNFIKHSCGNCQLFHFRNERCLYTTWLQECCFKKALSRISSYYQQQGCDVLFSIIPSQIINTFFFVSRIIIVASLNKYRNILYPLGGFVSK